MPPTNNDLNGPAIAFLTLAIFFLLLLILVWIRYLVWWNSPLGRGRGRGRQRSGEAKGRDPKLRPDGSRDRSKIDDESRRRSPWRDRGPRPRSPASSDSMGSGPPPPPTSTKKYPPERQGRYQSGFRDGAGARNERGRPDGDLSDGDVHSDDMRERRKETSPVGEYQNRYGSQHSDNEAMQQQHSSDSRGEPLRARSEVRTRTEPLADPPGVLHDGGGRRVAFAGPEDRLERRDDGRARERGGMQQGQEPFVGYLDGAQDDMRSRDSASSFRHTDRRRDRQESRRDDRARDRSPIRSV